MKAAVLVEPNIIEVREIDYPTVGADEVIVKVAYCGICGSDVSRVFNGTSKCYPNILGHEFSGIVVEVGSVLNEDLVGRRVSGIPLIPCGSCSACKSGNYALCNSYDFIGSRRFGALAEYVAVPISNIYLLNDIDLLSAAFFEPATVAMHAVDLVDIQPNASVIVVGCGTIGLFLGQILHTMGVQHVVAVGRQKKRLEAALAAGFDSVVDTTSAAWMDGALDITNGNGYECVFDTSGNAELMPAAFGLAANKGNICVVGTPKTPVTFKVNEWEQINRRELKVLGAWMSYSAPFPGSEWDRVASYFETKNVFCSPGMIDAVYALDDAQKAFDRFIAPPKVSGKIIIVCNEDLVSG